MNGTSGISGSPPPEEIPGLGKVEGADVQGLLHAKVATLGELKAVLIKYLGEKEGLKFYNRFMESFVMIMLQQIQHSAEQAKEASQNMRMNTQG